MTENAACVYIGSTCKTIGERYDQHMAMYARGDRKYTSFQVFEHGNTHIELIEHYVCESKEQLHRRETFWIKSSPFSVNKILPYVSAEQRAVVKNRRYDCVCGLNVRFDNRCRHERSVEHVARLAARASDES